MLKQVGTELYHLEKSLQHKGLMLHTPTHNNDCCSLSALECFRVNVNRLQTTKKNLQRKLSKNLMTPMIKASCPPCSSYPKSGSEQFVQELQFLLQKATNRLMWKQNTS
ncbi:hypothetical protein SKAU_G00031440 [Synaphobranchus kaupii]|uniref:Interleukin n=1 Tax=Synaphobranchus kaupii TaxID=118154 RepID=A0A9Q1GDQ2_SYNKA|nr:hypothetical protein SKAU_G00031440 [Synaphobranchus kaupii]